jgi:hypothetical protein
MREVPICRVIHVGSLKVGKNFGQACQSIWTFEGKPEQGTTDSLPFRMANHVQPPRSGNSFDSGIQLGMSSPYAVDGPRNVTRSKGWL